MKIRVEVSKGQTGELPPAGFTGAVTGRGTPLYGDSASVEFKDGDNGEWTTGAIVDVIGAMGKTVADAIVAVADKPAPEVHNG
jgi:hypothetical protein